MNNSAHIVHSEAEGEAVLKRLEFPILIIPWGEDSGASQYVVRSADSFHMKLALALADAMYRNAAHVIQLADLASNPRPEATYKGTPS